jgi:hypothetical protein
MRPTRSTPVLSVRTGLSAGGYSGCLSYCDQERSRCVSNPAIPRGVCDDRYPVCQNACAACASSGA